MGLTGNTGDAPVDTGWADLDSFPKYYLVPRDGQLRQVACHNRDEVARLRTELELLRGIDRTARMRVVIKPVSSATTEGVYALATDADRRELATILGDARNPAVCASIEFIDEEFADVKEEMMMSVVNDESERIVQEAVAAGAAEPIVADADVGGLAADVTAAVPSIEEALEAAEADLAEVVGMIDPADLTEAGAESPEGGAPAPAGTDVTASIEELEALAACADETPETTADAKAPDMGVAESVAIENSASESADTASLADQEPANNVKSSEPATAEEAVVGDGDTAPKQEEPADAGAQRETEPAQRSPVGAEPEPTTELETQEAECVQPNKALPAQPGQSAQPEQETNPEQPTQPEQSTNPAQSDSTVRVRDGSAPPSVAQAGLDAPGDGTTATAETPVSDGRAATKQTAAGEGNAETEETAVDEARQTVDEPSPPNEGLSEAPSCNDEPSEAPTLNDAPEALPVTPEVTTDPDRGETDATTASEGDVAIATDARDDVVACGHPTPNVSTDNGRTMTPDGAKRAIDQITSGVQKLAEFFDAEVNERCALARESLEQIAKLHTQAASAQESVAGALEEITRIREEARIARDDADIARREARLLREDTRKAKERAEAGAAAAEAAADLARGEQLDAASCRTGASA